MDHVEQWRIDREFLRLVGPFKSSLFGVDHLGVTDGERDLRGPVRAGATLGTVLAAAVAIGLVRSGRPWWLVLGFVLYGGPLAVLLWMSATATLAWRLRTVGSARRSAPRATEGAQETG